MECHSSKYLFVWLSATYILDFHGKVDVSQIISYSKVPLELQAMFQYDFALLKNRLERSKQVHLIPDLTQIGGEERLGLVAFAEALERLQREPPKLNINILYKGKLYYY